MKALRKTDMVFRYGGDEFMVLLLDTPRKGAEVIGRRLKTMFDKRWAEEWSPKRGCPLVSISLDVAEFDQHESSKGLIRRADFLMGEAKKRDRR